MGQPASDHKEWLKEELIKAYKAARLGKSVGSCLYLTTQHPSINVLTHGLRGSISGRLAFRV